MIEKKKRRPLTEEELSRLEGDGELGPCMKALTQRQQLFVLALLNQGSKLNYMRASMRAGYQGGVGVHRVNGHILAHDPKIQGAVLEYAKSRFQVATLAATGLCAELVSNEEISARDRLKAAELILDRGGIHKMVDHRVEHTHSLGREEKLLRIRELALLVGQDPRVLLGNLSDVVEADYEILVEKSA